MKNRFVVSSVAALAAILVTAGIAFAVWSASGSGNGGGAAAIAQGLTITAVTPTGAAANIYPGGPAGTVYFTVNNPNPYAVTITSITWGTPTSGNPTNCPNADISVAPGAPTTGLSITIPPGPPTGSTSLAGVLLLAHSAPDGCQGISFFVPMTVTGVQN